jgi:hypothetical protein
MTTKERKLEVIIEPYDSLPCSLEKFTINGIDAHYNDFGDSCDVSSHEAEPYGCGDYRFIPKMPTDEVLEKYSINLKEYAEICNMLECALHVGSCGWCI